MLRWSKIGALCGALWGFVFDTALSAIPEIGPVLLSGPLVSWIVAVLEGAAVFAGVSALGAGLLSIGTPKHSVLQYEDELKTNKFLLIVHGTPVEVKQATTIIGGSVHSYDEAPTALALVH